jgi:glucosamine 6-phosphate synthetase-like amidotransferase/phosphosugar isomerase protein
VHNGVLYNFLEQSKFLETQYNINRSLEVDSELIIRMLSLLLSTNSEKDALKRVLHTLDGEMSCLCINKETKKLYAFMKNKILFRGEDAFGNIYFFSTLYIKNKVPEIFQNIKEYHNYDIEIL